MFKIFFDATGDDRGFKRAVRGIAEGWAEEITPFVQFLRVYKMKYTILLLAFFFMEPIEAQNAGVLKNLIILCKPEGSAPIDPEEMRCDRNLIINKYGNVIVGNIQEELGVVPMAQAIRDIERSVGLPPTGRLDGNNGKTGEAVLNYHYRFKDQGFDLFDLQTGTFPLGGRNVIEGSLYRYKHFKLEAPTDAEVRYACRRKLLAGCGIQHDPAMLK